MIHKTFDNDLAPSDVYSWQAPDLAWFLDNNLYGFLNKIDRSRTSIYINMNRFGNLPVCDTDIAIISMFGETPRFETVHSFCGKNVDCRVILLGDFDLYDYPLPDQVTFLSYRHWIWYLDWLVNSKQKFPIGVKQKKIDYKFSSLSFNESQFRALVTCWLLSNARSDSLVSWHAIKNLEKDYLITAMKDYPKFRDLDWSQIEHKHLIDSFSEPNNTPISNFLDMHHPGYAGALININNETCNFGWLHADDGTSYNRPGPYLTEKTWKSLLSGCVPLNSGQPGLYKWLDTAYDIPCKWSIPTEYDQEIKDFDRAHMLVQTLEYLNKQDLSSLIDSNIDYCEIVQNQLLNNDYIEHIYNFNRKQDEKILEICGSV